MVSSDDPLHRMVLVVGHAVLAAGVAAVDNIVPAGPAAPAPLRWSRSVGAAGCGGVPAGPGRLVVADTLAGEQERPAVWVAGLALACVGAVVFTVVFGERPRDLREAFVDQGGL